MAKLAVAAAEEHVGRPARDAGLVAVYAQVQRSYSHNITCQACSALLACRRKGHAQLHEAWTSCFVQAGMFFCACSVQESSLYKDTCVSADRLIDLIRIETCWKRWGLSHTAKDPDCLQPGIQHGVAPRSLYPAQQRAAKYLRCLSACIASPLRNALLWPCRGRQNALQG
jgi:hypothetical protein